MAGLNLSVEPLWFHHDASVRSALALAFVMVFALPVLKIVNRNKIRQLVQPRLEELEALRAGLNIGE